MLATLPPSCADCLEILGASKSWSPQGLSRVEMGLLYNCTVFNARTAQVTTNWTFIYIQSHTWIYSEAHVDIFRGTRGYIQRHTWIYSEAHVD